MFVGAGALIIRGPVRSGPAGFALRCRGFVAFVAGVLAFLGMPNLIFGIFCGGGGGWTMLKLFWSSPESSLSKIFPSSFGRIVSFSGSTMRAGVVVICDVLIITGGKMSSSLRSTEFTRELERLEGFLAELGRLLVGRAGFGVAGKSSLSHVSNGG